MKPRPLISGALTGAVFAAAVALLLQLSPSLFGLEWLWTDLHTRRLARTLEPDPDIVLVLINEKSIRSLEEFYGRPPWTRELMARVVEEVARGGGRMVVFDLLFGEENFSDPAGDRRFAASMETIPVVLGAQTGGVSAAGGDTPLWAGRFWRLQGVAEPIPLPLIAPHPMFAPAAAIGSMELTLEERAAVTRRYAVLRPVGEGAWLPSLATAAAATALGLPHEGRMAPRRGDELLVIGSRSIPVDEGTAFSIRWRSGAEGRGYRAVDFDALIGSSIAREEGSQPGEALDAPLRGIFEGSIAIVGSTATGLLDLRATPLSPTAPGVEIHANALDNLLRGEFNRRVDPLLFIPLLLLGAAAVGAFCAVVHSQAGAAAVAILAAGGWLVSTPLALRGGVLVPSVAPAIAIGLTWAAVTLARLVVEQKRSSVLRATFGRYVSPQILDYLLEHPEKVDLGGERRDLTILFSDIRGFTSISEASEPEEVVEMLNEYLTRMVDILLRHGGTLDKFIGDAVMGFWNAPTTVADHPRRAVECAIEMIEETARLREQWEAEGKASIRIGIGINTGEAVVGNIGSKRVFGYTVIGDAVNLASRLESKNKDYGTEIIVSEFTRERMGEDVPAFYLDEVKVKGKSQAVRIYEIRGRA